jgi:hypothetical protein
MMRQSFRRRPEVESLESMVLLSGLSMVERPGVAALVARQAQINSSTPLSGTATGTYTERRGAPIHFSAKGSFSSLGNSTLKGTLNLSTGNASGKVTISVKKQGKVFANLTEAGVGSPVLYTITGGTGKLAGASGSGEAFFTVGVGRGRGTSHGMFTLTLESF